MVKVASGLSFGSLSPTHPVRGPRQVKEGCGNGGLRRGPGCSFTPVACVVADATAVRVNGTHPAPDIHEHFTIQKGYGTLRISSRTTSTILSAL